MTTMSEPAPADIGRAPVGQLATISAGDGAYVEIHERLFEDPRFERGQAGPAAGHTLMMLLTHAARTRCRTFSVITARSLCRVADPAPVIDALVEYGFLVGHGEYVQIADQPELWRLA